MRQKQTSNLAVILIDGGISLRNDFKLKKKNTKNFKQINLSK